MQENFQFDIRLEWLQMTNFRGFDRLNLSFHKNLTVLIGKNGTGKTSIIEAAAGLLQVLIDKISSQNIGDIQGFGEKDIKNGTIQAINEIALSVNGEILEWNATLTAESYEPDTQLYETIIEKLLDNGVEVLDDNGIPIEIEKLVPLDADRQPFGKLEQLVREANKLLNDKIEINLPVILYYPCFTAQQELPNGNGEKLKTNIFRIYDNALSGRAFELKAFFEWFRWQEQRALSGRKDSKVIVNTISNAVYDYLNDAEKEFDNLTIDWDVPDGELVIFKSDQRLAVNQLSSGEKTLFLLVTDLARRLAIANPDKPNPLHGNGIVLIDEIDLHLHPAKQREVLPKLLDIFPNVQFVVTTHSPLVLSKINSKHVLILEDGHMYSATDTKGQDFSTILDKVMDVPYIYQEELNHIFDLIALDKIEEVGRAIESLELKIEGSLPELTRAKAIIKRKQLLAK